MSDDPHPKSPVEIIPSIQGGISAIGSAHAPFLYFEGATSFGILNGVVQITLEAQRIFPTATGSPATDRVIVAHLRMNVPAALSLRASIDGALLLANPGPTQTKN
jgi:hypothetical protein